jgi:hypothetical protein
MRPADFVSPNTGGAKMVLSPDRAILPPFHFITIRTV